MRSNTAKDGEEGKGQNIPCRKATAGTKISGMAVTKCEEGDMGFTIRS